MKLKISDDAFFKIHLGEAGMAEWIDHLGHKVLGAYLNVPEREWTLIESPYTGWCERTAVSHRLLLD